MSYYLRRLTAAVSCIKWSCCLRQSEPHDVVANTRDCSMFPLPANSWRVLQLQSWMFSVLLLTVFFPVVICDNRLCSSDRWCVSTDAVDPCSLYSSQTGNVGHFCSCIPYRNKFSVCLDNVSSPDTFKLLILKLV